MKSTLATGQTADPTTTTPPPTTPNPTTPNTTAPEAAKPAPASGISVTIGADQPTCDCSPTAWVDRGIGWLILLAGAWVLIALGISFIKR